MGQKCLIRHLFVSYFCSSLDLLTDLSPKLHIEEHNLHIKICDLYVEDVQFDKLIPLVTGATDLYYEFTSAFSDGYSTKDLITFLYEAYGINYQIYSGFLKQNFEQNNLILSQQKISQEEKKESIRHFLVRLTSFIKITVSAEFVLLTLLHLLLAKRERHKDQVYLVFKQYAKNTSRSKNNLEVGTASEVSFPLINAKLSRCSRGAQICIFLISTSNNLSMIARYLFWNNKREIDTILKKYKSRYSWQAIKYALIL